MKIVEYHVVVIAFDQIYILQVQSKP